MAVFILDNRTTRVTGHQENPGTGKTLMGESSPAVDIERIVGAVGVKGENVLVFVAFEKSEAARCLASLKPDGVLLVNDHEIPSLTVLTGEEPIPATLPKGSPEP